MVMALHSVVFLCFAAAAGGETLRIPAASGPLTVDGIADEEIWNQATVLSLHSADFGSPFPASGEMRAVVRGGVFVYRVRLLLNRCRAAGASG
jgi:hypothetical protein